MGSRHAILTGDSTCERACSTSMLIGAICGQSGSTPPKHSAVGLPQQPGVVEVLQGAWSAISTTPIPRDDPVNGVFRIDHLRLALDAGVRGGNDTDAVAAIAGGLLGAVYGPSTVPAEWRRVLHGWPGLSTRGLVDLGGDIIRGGKPDEFDFSYAGYKLGVAISILRMTVSCWATLGLCGRCQGHWCGRVAVPSRQRLKSQMA
jgi:ADP-ribosylglycohydrolase